MTSEAFKKITLAQLSTSGNPVYSGVASSNVVIDNIIRFNTFIFNESKKTIEVLLPSRHDILNLYGFDNLIKNIMFFIPHDKAVSVVLRGVSEGLIVDQANTVFGSGEFGSIVLNPGNSIILLYSSGIYTYKGTNTALTSNVASKGTEPVSIESGLYVTDTIVSDSVPPDATRILGLFINKEQQGQYEQRQRVDTYSSYTEWENAGSPEPANLYFLWDESLQQNVLDYIEVTVSWQEFVPYKYSKNYGVISIVEGAKNNIAFAAIKGKITALYGGVVSWDVDYCGPAYSDVLENKIGCSNQFFFTSISASNLLVRLPSASMIAENTFGDVTFLLHITVDFSTPNSIRLTSVANGQLYNNGNALSYIDMSKGNTILLRYAKGTYTIVEYRN